MQTLRDLLEQAKVDRAVRSGRALADLAEKHGQKIDRTQVNAILGGTYKSRPQRPLLEAIAWLSNAELEDVYAAAELPMPGPSFADELPPDVDYLGPRERHAVITVIRAFLGAAEQGELMGNAEQHPAANTVAPPVELRPAARKTSRLTAEERREAAELARKKAPPPEHENPEADESPA